MIVMELRYLKHICIPIFGQEHRVLVPCGYDGSFFYIPDRLLHRAVL